MGTRCALRESKFSFYKGMLRTQPTTIKRIFQHFAWIISCLHIYMHKTCTTFCLTKAIVLLPSLTHSPSWTEICPRAPCLKESENLQQLQVFIQHKTVGEHAHIEKLKKYHLQLQQVCNACVYVCACEWKCWYSTSVHECVRTMLIRSKTSQNDWKEQCLWFNGIMS